MKKPLYIHLHIPKTAGYTFRYHITKNLKKGEHLLLDYEFLNLDLFNPPLKYRVYKRQAFDLIKSFTQNQKDQIKIIHGHAVPYGIHKLFPNREVRYISFFRNPLDRTLSIYNHLSYLNTYEGNIPRMRHYYETYLLFAGKDRGFKTWLKRRYVNDLKFLHFSTVGYLKEFGYLSGVITKNSVNSALAKFYFTGLTENFGEESLFFFKELNMNKFFIDQNISKKMSGRKINKKLQQEIVKRNKLDYYTYQKVLILNRKFRKNSPDFIKKIQQKRLQKLIFLPLTQLLFAPRQSLIRFMKLLLRRGAIRSKPTYFSDHKN